MTTPSEKHRATARDLVWDYGHDASGLLVGAITAALEASYKAGLQDGWKHHKDVVDFAPTKSEG
jgi:hypothetical protein